MYLQTLDCVINDYPSDFTLNRKLQQFRVQDED